MTDKVRELILQQKFDYVLKNQPRPKIFCRFEFGHLHIGTQSLHRTVFARMYRLQLRFKRM